MPESVNCSLCNQPVQKISHENGRDIYTVYCQRCGEYKISDQALGFLKDDQKHLLSAVCRKFPQTEILSTNIEQLVSSAPKYSPIEKLQVLLAYCAEMTPVLGEESGFDAEKDYPLISAKNAEEVYFLLSALSNRGFVKLSLGDLTVVMEGWEYLEELKRTEPSSDRCFVAMSFSDRMITTYESAIEPAIRECGFEPVRLDRHEHTNRVDDEIVGQIRRSRFMVADFTEQRAGVYFEAGMMLGVGRNVIWMCDKKELESGELHFDIRQFNFIDYESTDEARLRLRNRILAIEGEGPLIR